MTNMVLNLNFSVFCVYSENLMSAIQIIERVLGNAAARL